MAKHVQLPIQKQTLKWTLFTLWNLEIISLLAWRPINDFKRLHQLNERQTEEPFSFLRQSDSNIISLLMHCVQP